MNYKVRGQHPEVWLENRNTPLEHQATHLLFLRSGLPQVLLLRVLLPAQCPTFRTRDPVQLWAELLTATSRITFRDFSCVLWLQDIKDAFLVVKLVFSGSLSVGLQYGPQSLHPEPAGRL